MQETEIYNHRYCSLKISVLHTDNDIQLTGTLVDHLNVDVCVCQCGEDSSGSASRSSHAAAYNSDQRQIGLKVNGIRLYRTVQSCDDLLLFFCELVLVNEYSHGIDAGRHMFEGKIVVLKNTEHFSAKADLGIHHALLNRDGCKAFLYNHPDYAADEKPSDQKSVLIFPVLKNDDPYS